MVNWVLQSDQYWITRGICWNRCPEHEQVALYPTFGSIPTNLSYCASFLDQSREEPFLIRIPLLPYCMILDHKLTRINLILVMINKNIPVLNRCRSLRSAEIQSLVPVLQSSCISDKEIHSSQLVPAKFSKICPNYMVKCNDGHLWTPLPNRLDESGWESYTLTLFW